ncbi:hypothetical protein KY290_013033 [Solanum tuberosum]|uniref:Uncharacterized protein n=1 Tax=Solanum tuberosum TaxID=4113 RepID=A0ABQ7VNH7_SOLTU|nr:hypothetical protein KY285_012802 [Solanum tuberosum]KAH0769052.1 hypothetical protein KY290_013033 [Solanum tuberosum]
MFELSVGRLLVLESWVSRNISWHFWRLEVGGWRLEVGVWRGWLVQGLEVRERIWLVIEVVSHQLMRVGGVACGEPLIVTLEYTMSEVMVRVIVEL